MNKRYSSSNNARNEPADKNCQAKDTNIAPSYSSEEKESRPFLGLGDGVERFKTNIVHPHRADMGSVRKAADGRFYIPIDVENYKLEALLATGASFSFLSKRLAERMRIEYKRIYGVCAHSLPAYYRRPGSLSTEYFVADRDLTIKCNGKSFSHNFYIADLIDDDCILGMDLFFAVGFGITGAANVEEVDHRDFHIPASAGLGDHQRREPSPIHHQDLQCNLPMNSDINSDRDHSPDRSSRRYTARRGGGPAPRGSRRCTARRGGGHGPDGPKRYFARRGRN